MKRVEIIEDLQKLKQFKRSGAPSVIENKEYDERTSSVDAAQIGRAHV